MRKYVFGLLIFSSCSSAELKENKNASDASSRDGARTYKAFYGKYEKKDGMGLFDSFTFKENNVALAGIRGKSATVNYLTSGDTVKVKLDNTTLLFLIKDDNTIVSIDNAPETFIKSEAVTN